MSYRLITLDQQSEEWHTWRKTGIGASDAPILMGFSKYMKPRRLWEEKVGLISPKPFSQFVQDRAKNVENAARATLELSVGKNYPAVCMESVEYPWMKASLDGYSDELKSVLEAKWVGADKVTGKLPASHWIQIQHQLYVSGALNCVYMRSNDGYNFNSDIIQRDENYMVIILKEEIEFWKMVLNNLPPDDIRREAGWESKLNDSMR